MRMALYLFPPDFFAAIRCQEQVTDWLLLAFSSPLPRKEGRETGSIANEKYDFV